MPGSELEVKPLDDRRSPIVLRIVAVEPRGKDGFRYDLEYYGLEPGTFDLKDYLQRIDRSSVADLPALPVTIASVLPPGQIKPHELEWIGGPRLGGYRLFLILAGVLWVLGMAAILLLGHRRKKQEPVHVHRATLADHLRPLVEEAMAGKMEHARLAELERTLILYWSRRLHMADRTPACALMVLRSHPEAGRLLRQLEIWLHQPGVPGTIDVVALLSPYQHLPADGFLRAEQEKRSA